MSGGRKRLTYSAVDPQPDLPPRRAWLSPTWKRPGPPQIPVRIQFGPDFAAHLPVWGVDWQNPPFSKELLRALVAWQDTYDDHGIDVWPEVEWEEWQSEGQRLLKLVQRELGPDVEIKITF
jgi:hypothetical protein